MRKSRIAQAGGGDPNVIAHPSFREIPPCLFPLESENSLKEYDTLARQLFQAGKLTMEKHRHLSLYASQIDVINTAQAKKWNLKPTNFAQAMKTLAALELDEIDKPIAAAQDAPTSKYARCGFASRRG